MHIFTLSVERARNISTPVAISVLRTQIFISNTILQFLSENRVFEKMADSRTGVQNI